jgi:AbrB family looped-hinge helix DNA binding protein
VKTSTMTVKGQVTVPKELREAFGWKAGDEVEFVREKDGVKILPVKRRRKGQHVVERLRRSAPNWNPELTSARLMALTRGQDP